MFIAKNLMGEEAKYYSEEEYNELYKQLRKKEEECNSLKSQLDYEIQKFDVLEEEFKYEEEMNIELAKESVEVNGKLKQTIDEIEEYTMNVICDDCVNAPCEDCPNNHVLQIIQKIKE